MDGIRAYWNTEKLISRHGKEISAPGELLEGLQSTPLDGELWMGRGTYEKLVGVLNSRDTTDPKWKEIVYCVFDLPGSKEPYEQRMKDLQCMKFPQNVLVHGSIECKGREHMQLYLNSILEKEGEGLVMREPGGLYTPNGFTSSLLKVKVQLKGICVEFRRLTGTQRCLYWKC